MFKNNNNQWMSETTTLQECLYKCSNAIEANTGRRCVGIQWADKGQSFNKLSRYWCAFAYQCDFTRSWLGGSVYKLIKKSDNSQCSVFKKGNSNDNLGIFVFYCAYIFVYKHMYLYIE